jgi:transposase
VAEPHLKLVPGFGPIERIGIGAVPSQQTKREMTKRKIGPAMSAKIALEALREHATVADLAQRYQVSSEPDLRLEEAGFRNRRCGPSRPVARVRASTSARLSVCTPRSGS